VSSITDSKGAGAYRVTDATSEPFIVVSLEGRVVCWSPSAQSSFGYSTDEAIGKDLDELIVVDELRAENSAARAAAVAHGSVVFETVRRRKDGSRIRVKACMRRADARDGPLFIACTEMDATGS
jgi:protein-histidine pros-kinase